ncbi:MAG: type III secretion system inner rod subunit SctI [Pseudomonadota bacterium]
MPISVTSSHNLAGPALEPAAVGSVGAPADKTTSVLNFENSMARADAIMPEKVAYFAPEGISAPPAVNAQARPEGFVLTQATPQDGARSGAEGIGQTAPVSEPGGASRISTFRTIGTPVQDAPVVEAPTTGQGIIDGLSRLRGVFDAQEQAITGISPADVAGTRLTNSSELINLQLEVVKYSMLMDVTSKLAGKSTQTFDTLMKGQ